MFYLIYASPLIIFPQYENQNSYQCIALAEVFAMVRDLIENGPTQDELDKAREKLRRERETNLRENSFWASTLKIYCQYREGKFETFCEFDPVVEGLTRESMRSAASRTFDFKNYISVTLMPEENNKEP